VKCGEVKISGNKINKSVLPSERNYEHIKYRGCGECLPFGS
jgi:hypothetical protein